MTPGFVIFSGPLVIDRPPIIEEVAAAGGGAAEQPGLACEAQLLAVLAGGPREGETIEAAFTRKEREVGAVFARLSPVDVALVQQKIAAADDALGAAFARLNEARRERLLGFLARRRRA